MKKTTNKNAWETPQCNLCHSTDYLPLWSDLTYWEYPGVFQVVQCKKCQLVFTSPRPQSNEMKKYYDHISYFAIETGSDLPEKTEIEEREKRYGNIYTILLTQKKAGKILDIGAGTGLFLSKFKEMGWDVEGIELNPDAIKYAKKNYGLSLHKGDFSSFRFKEQQYDVITLNGVLEHVYDPQETLKKAYLSLKKGGILLLSVPNINSMGRTIFGKNWFAWLPPQHLYHFSPKTIKAILASAGFKETIIRHDYQLQNYYILFESLRYAKSPRFKKKKKGGLATSNYKRTFSLKKSVGKIVGHAFAFTVSALEPLIKRGEVLIVHTKK